MYNTDLLEPWTTETWWRSSSLCPLWRWQPRCWRFAGPTSQSMVRWKPWALAAPRPSMQSRRDPHGKDPPGDGTNHNNNSHSNSTHAATVLCSTPQDVPPALPKLLSVVHVGKLDTSSTSVGQPRDDREPLDNANPSRMADPSPGRTGSMMLELTLTPTVTRWKLLQSWMK